MKQNFIRVFSTNLIKMCVTFITAFIVPMVLDVDSYGYLKLYQFYVSYIGLTHLGFCDGIYLEYGGKEPKSIDAHRISLQGSSLFVYESILAAVVVICGIFARDFIIICCGITMLPQIMYTFYNYVFQAVGDFKRYTQVINAYSIVNLFVNLALVGLKIRDYRVYVLLYMVIETVPFVVGTVLFQKNDWCQFTGFNRQIFVSSVKLGFLLMIGNFAYTIFLGIDKWFIKFTMGIESFSFYSFASQLLTVVNMFITPVAMTLYSTMSQRKDKEFEKKIKSLLVVFLMAVPLVTYMLNFIIEMFMEQYKPAIKVTALLFVSQIFLCLNTAIFVNLYKVYRQQKEYFKRLCISISAAVLLDGMIALIKPSITYYSFSTLISCMIWLGLNLKYFPYLCPSRTELCYVCALLGVYAVAFDLPYVVKIAVYMVVYVVLTWKLMRDEWNYCKSQVIGLIKKIKLR